MTVDAATSLRLISESLGLVDRFGARPIHVEDVRMLDRTLVVDIQTSSEGSVAIQAEVCGVMGALSGLDVPNLFPVLEVQSFGVRAYHASGQELLWIVSSIEVAGFAAKGQPIEWLSRSLVQENTPEYRRSQADRVIGQVETALRDLLDFHAMEVAGESYMEQLWDMGTVQAIRDRAHKELGQADEGRSLLDYVYLAQLRDVIVQNIEWFDECLPVAPVLERSITKLNLVRRKVAHHRFVSEEDVRICRESAEAVFVPMGQRHPGFAGDFLVDRWEEQVPEIVEVAKRGVEAQVVPERGTVSEVERRRAVVNALRSQLDSVESAVSALGRIVVPPQRRAIHDAAAAALVRWRDALQELVAAAKRPGLTAHEAEGAQSAYKAALDDVSKLSRKIQSLRVGMPAS